MSDTQAKFIRAICESPQEDMPRLVYADWLVENHVNRPCDNDCRQIGGLLGTRVYESCGPESRWAVCPVCKGRGGIANGFADHAAFIRVQIELASMDPYHISCRGVKCSLPQCRTARQLLASPNWSRWTGSCLAFDKPQNLDWRRGFVWGLSITTAEFLTHAQEIFATMPVESVRLTDREPWGMPEHSRVASWYNVDRPDRDPDDLVHPQSDVPNELFDLLADAEEKDKRVAYFKSMDQAEKSMIRATVAYGRELAGLPPI